MDILSRLLTENTPTTTIITSIQQEIVYQKSVVRLGARNKDIPTPGTPMPLNKFIELIQQSNKPTRQSILQKIDAVIIPQKAGAEEASWLKVAQEINEYYQEKQLEEQKVKQEAEQAEQERIKQEAEQAEQERIKQEAEQKRIEQEAERKRIEQEAERKRIEQEAERKRIEQEAERKRIEQEAERKRIEQEAERKRIEQEERKKQQVQNNSQPTNSDLEAEKTAVQSVQEQSNENIPPVVSPEKNIAEEQEEHKEDVGEHQQGTNKGGFGSLMTAAKDPSNVNLPGALTDEAIQLSTGKMIEGFLGDSDADLGNVARDPTNAVVPKVKPGQFGDALAGTKSNADINLEEEVYGGIGAQNQAQLTAEQQEWQLRREELKAEWYGKRPDEMGEMQFQEAFNEWREKCRSELGEESVISLCYPAWNEQQEMMMRVVKERSKDVEGMLLTIFSSSIEEGKYEEILNCLKGQEEILKGMEEEYPVFVQNCEQHAALKVQVEAYKQDFLAFIQAKDEVAKQQASIGIQEKQANLFADRANLIQLWDSFAQTKDLRKKLDLLEGFQPSQLSSSNDEKIKRILQEIEKKKGQLAKLIKCEEVAQLKGPGKEEEFQQLIEHREEGLPVQLEKHVPLIESCFSVHQPLGKKNPNAEQMQDFEYDKLHSRYYQERQDAKASTCGVHVSNTWVGMPIVTIEQANVFGRQNMKERLAKAGMDVPEENIGAYFPGLEAGADGGLDFEYLLKILEEKGFPATLESRTREAWTKNLDGGIDIWQEDLLLKMIESQHRIIISRNDHFVTLRKNEDIGKWVEVNSLDDSQKHMFSSIKEYIQSSRMNVPNVQDQNSVVIKIIF